MDLLFLIIENYTPKKGSWAEEKNVGGGLANKLVVIECRSEVTMPKKKNKPSPKIDSKLPRRLAEGLEQAFHLVEHKRLSEAQEILEDLDRCYPDEPEVLAQLAHVTIEQQDWAGFLYASERLAPFAPDDPELQLALAGAYLTNGYPASALATINRFLQRWPEHEDAEEARQMQAELKENMKESFARWHADPGEGLALMRRYEAVHILIDQGRLRQAITQAEAILQEHADFLPLLNTLSMAYWSNGLVEKAVATAERVLAVQPQDAFALGNLAQFALLSGKVDDALGYAQRLKASVTDGDERAVKWIELASHLGDDAGVLEAFASLQGEGTLEDMGPQAAYMHHLAATAWARQGDLSQARQHWEKALELAPDFDLAQGNLDDLGKADGERNGPYSHTFQHWLSPRASEDLERAMQSAPQGNDTAFERAMRGWLGRHPEILPLAPSLLRLGDETVRNFMLSLSEISRNPELLLAVKEFALGQGGRDELRLAAANLCASAGVLPSGMQRLWIKGEWTNTLLMGVDLRPSEGVRHGPKVEKWLRAALKSAHEGQYKQAETLLQQALAVEPEAPDLLYNLAAAYQSQGRLDEADALVTQVHERFPDYLFASVNLAQMSIQRGDLENARRLLEPLRQRTQMSYSEFDAFCAAHIELFRKEGDEGAAQAWLGVWESVDPENPKLARYKEKVG